MNSLEMQNSSKMIEKVLKATGCYRLHYTITSSDGSIQNAELIFNDHRVRESGPSLSRIYQCNLFTGIEISLSPSLSKQMKLTLLKLEHAAIAIDDLI